MDKHVKSTICTVYVSDTPVASKQGQSLKPPMTMQSLSKVINMQSLKDLALMESEKRPTFFVVVVFFPIEEVCNFLSACCCYKKLYIHDLLN